MRAILAWLIATTVSAASIEIPAATPLGSPIVATIKDLPAGAKVAWKGSQGVSVIKVGDSAHVWGVNGSHTIDAVVASADDLEWLTAAFAVGAPGPAPPPVPPLVVTLKELAGKDAPLLAAIYADLATGKFSSSWVFRRAEELSLGHLKSNGAATAISARLTAVIGAPTQTAMPANVHANLVAELLKIAVELGHAPQPPPVPPTPEVGPRRVVILHETAEVTPALANSIVKLRSGEAANYLKSKGHTLLILDDDSTNSNGAALELATKLKAEGVELPAAYVLDGQTVLAKQHIDDATAADQVMALLKGAGG